MYNTGDSEAECPRHGVCLRSNYAESKAAPFETAQKQPARARSSDGAKFLGMPELP
jgi:hypothetical protein